MPFEDIQQAYQHYQGRLLILGNPGAGKTTTLMAFARDCVAKRLDDVSAPLPIVAPVMLWNPDQGLGFSEWVTQLIPSRAAEVQTALENGELLLLLDGLDELGDAREGQNERGEKVTYDPRQVFVQQLPSKNRVILTCRNTDFDDLKLQLPLTGAITLQPLDERAGHVAPRWSNYGTIVEIL